MTVNELIEELQEWSDAGFGEGLVKIYDNDGNVVVVGEVSALNSGAVFIDE